MKKRGSFYKNLIYPTLALVLFMAVWQAAAVLLNFELVLPRPSSVAAELGSIVSRDYFINAAAGTLMRSLKGFFVSAALAAVLAAASAFLPALHKMLSPLITFVRSVPTMSIILLVLIWVKSQTSPAVVAAMIVFPIMYSDFYFALKSADADILQMSKVYKVSRRTLIAKFYIPSAAPAVFESIRGCISLNLKVVIASEVLAQTRQSMGVLMQSAQLYLNTAELLAWTVVAVVLSFLLEGVVLLLRRAALRWEIPERT